MIQLLSTKHSAQRLPWPFTLNADNQQANGLSCWWSGSPSSGKQLYEWIYGQHGTLSGDTSWRSGFDSEVGTVLSFDGTGDYVEVADSDVVDVDAGDFSFSMWVRLNTVSASQALVAKKRLHIAADVGWGFYVYNDSRAYVAVSNGTQAELMIVDAGVFQTGKWTHFAVTFDRDGNATGYVDGVQQNSGSIASAAGSLSNSVNLRFGINGADTQFPYNGCMVDLRLYKRLLHPDEIYDMWHPSTRWQLFYRASAQRFFFGNLAGGTAFNVSVSDTAGHIDLHTRLASHFRSRQDVLGTLDAAARIGPAQRVFSDVLGFVDAFQRAVGGVLAIVASELLGCVDAASRTASTFRATVETASAVDAAQRLADASRAVVADSLGGVDALSKSALFVRAMQELVGNADASTAASLAFRLFAEAMGSSDSLLRVAAFLRQASEIAGTTDSAARATQLLRVLVETFGSFDAATLSGAVSIIAVALELKWSSGDADLKWNRDSSDYAWEE